MKLRRGSLNFLLSNLNCIKIIFFKFKNLFFKLAQPSKNIKKKNQKYISKFFKISIELLSMMTCLSSDNRW